MKEPEWWRITASAEKVIARHEAEIEFLKLQEEVKNSDWFFLPIALGRVAVIAQNYHAKINLIYSPARSK